jgi:hypothetical protein
VTHLLDQLMSRYFSEASVGPPSGSTSVHHLRFALLRMETPTTATCGTRHSVAISGTTAIAGAPGYSKDAGRAYVFAKTGSVWKQAAELKGSDTVASDDFGYTVAISGATAIAGAEGHAKDAGRAYVFKA